MSNATAEASLTETEALEYWAGTPLFPVISVEGAAWIPRGKEKGGTGILLHVEDRREWTQQETTRVIVFRRQSGARGYIFP